MSQSVCPNDSELYVAVSRPHGNGGPIENTKTLANPITENAQAMAAQQAEAAQQTQRVSAVRDAIDVDTLPSEPVGGGANAQLRAAGRRAFVDFAELAEAGQARRTAEVEAAFAKVSGTTIGEASQMLDFTNGVAKRFATQDADFNKWAVLNYQQEGRTIIDNSLVRAKVEAEAKTRGQLQIYTRMFDELHQQANPIAARLGWVTKDLMVAVGDYANARHAFERNRLLLARWEGELAALKAKGSKDVQRMTELDSKIFNLRENLDNETPDAHVQSSGYTDGEARSKMAEVLRETGLTEAEAAQLSDRLVDINAKITQDRMAAGMISPEVAADFPHFDMFVPYKTKLDNTTGPVNNANIYNPGFYHAIEGSSVKPDSAYDTIMHYARRASNEIGMQELGAQLAAAKRTALLRGQEGGLMQYDYLSLLRDLNSSNLNRKRFAENILNNENSGGIITDVPTFDPDGNAAGVRRVLLTFDKNWTDPVSKVSGAALNQALYGTSKVASGLNKAAQLTSLYGRMFTQFNPAFAPVNSIRDLVERVMHIAGRDYYDDGGNQIRGSSVIGRYLLNAPRAGKALLSALSGNIDPSTKLGVYWQEYVANGVHQEYTPGMHGQRQTLAEVLQKRAGPQGFIERLVGRKHPDVAGLQSILQSGNEIRQGLYNTLNKWNDYFNNIAPFTHYITLREAGVPTRNAAAGALEILNLHQQGTWTGALRALFPFVKPTVQTGVAMMRTMGLAPNAKGQFRPNVRGIAGLLGAYAGYLMLAPLIRDSMGYDPETGLSRYDQMSISDLQRFIPIGIGDEGDFVKIPTGFGLPQLAITLAISTDRVRRGMMAPEDLVAETLFAVGKNIKPGDWPEFSMKEQPAEWLAQAFMPTLAKPIGDLAMNVDYRGRPITTATSEGMRAKADQGYLSTPREYHQIAKWIHEYTGMDLAPEQVKNLMGNLAIGPLRVIRGLVEQDTLRSGGTSETAAEKMGPWLSAFGGSLYYGKTYDTNKGAYYSALNDMRARIRSEGISDITSREYGSNQEKREAYQAKKLREAGWSAEDINDFLLLMRAETLLRSNQSHFAQEVKPIWLSADTSGPIRDTFNKLAETQGNVYSTVVRNLNLYSRTR